MVYAAVLQIENVISGIRDSNLKLMLAFGIGIHHAGLVERDRKTVEELFVNQRIQVAVRDGKCLLNQWFQEVQGLYMCNDPDGKGWG